VHPPSRARTRLTFDVPKAKLTTDASLAARLVQNEYAAQEAAAQLSAQQMEADRQAQTAKRAGQLPQQPTAHDIYGSFVPAGGGPVMPATPENLARFGAPVYGTGANAARAIQAQVDRDLAAARQQQAQLQRAQAARRIAASNGRHRNQTAAQQQAKQRRMAGDDEAWLAKREAGKAENQIQDLKRQAGEVRERERYEYNKAASERGNQATYNVERAFDRNIQSLQGQINNTEREKAYWENSASQAEQRH